MNIPCKNCITLPICKSENKDLNVQTHWVESKTFNKCSILRDFYHFNGYSLTDEITKILSGKSRYDTM